MFKHVGSGDTLAIIINFFKNWFLIWIQHSMSGPLKKLFLFLIERYLLYSIVLVSAKHQHESTVGIYMSLPLEPPSPSHPSRLLQSL